MASQEKGHLCQKSCSDSKPGKQSECNVIITLARALSFREHSEETRRMSFILVSMEVNGSLRNPVHRFVYSDWKTTCDARGVTRFSLQPQLFQMANAENRQSSVTKPRAAN